MKRPIDAIDPETSQIDAELGAAVDLTSHAGALALKKRIEAEWRTRGVAIEVRIVGERRPDVNAVVFGLQSNTLNGQVAGLMPRHRPRFAMHEPEALVQNAIRQPLAARDACTIEGNQRLARKIAAYWERQGRRFTFQVEQRGTAYGIASNTLNGLPPYLGARAGLSR